MALVQAAVAWGVVFASRGAGWDFSNPGKSSVQYLNPPPPTPVPTPTTIDGDIVRSTGRNETDHADAFYCAKEFVPGNPGGFRTDYGTQACCALDRALSMMMLFYQLDNCKKWSKEGDFCSFDAQGIYHVPGEQTPWKLKADYLLSCCSAREFNADGTADHCRRAMKGPAELFEKHAMNAFQKCTGCYFALPVSCFVFRDDFATDF
jgi:hypothetical protein